MSTATLCGDLKINNKNNELWEQIRERQGQLFLFEADP